MITTRHARKAIEIASHYGETHQSIKALEELGELSQVIAKYLTSGTDKFPDFRERFIEESADVMLMMAQLNFLWNIDNEDIVKAVEAKIDRQTKRMNKEKRRNGQIFF